MSIKKIMHKDRHGAQVSVEFGEGGAASQLVEQFLGGMGVPAMQDIPQQHPGGPKGTDTVPAWLTPGEFVMNAEATRMFEPQIEEMNNAGRAVQRQQGGSIPEYKADGGVAGSWVNESVLDAGLGGSYEVPTVEDVTTLPTTADGVLESLKRTVPPKDDGRLFPKYDPVAAREEQAKLEAANRIERAKAEEEYNRKNLESRGKGYAGTLGMFGLEVPPVNEDIEAQITAIDKQRVLGQIPDTIAASRIKALRDKETINQIARETAAAGEQKEVASQVSELERQAQLLEDAGYTDDANALREEASGLTSGTVGPEAEPEDDDATISGLIDAGNKAKEVKIPEGEGVAETEEPSAWDKVKDFFKEGFGTVLDKGALSEAATLYLGSRALGYGHEGSLNFVAKRYGKGIEDKIANANKAVGTHTPESITKYKDTGNLMDLKKIPELTDLGKPAYFVARDGTTYDLRTVKDEKGKVKHIDASGAVIDTTKMLTSAEFTQREKANKDRVRKLIEGRKKTMSASNKAAGDDDFDADLLVDTEQVVEAMTNYFMSNGVNTTKAAEQTGYVIDGIVNHRRNPDMKDISDRDLTELLLNKAVAVSMDKNIFEPDKGQKKIPPAVSAKIIDMAIPNIDALNGPVAKGQLLRIIRQNGYLKLSPSEREGYIDRSGGKHNGFLQYLKEGRAGTDKKKWQPAWQEFNNNPNKI